MIILKVTKYQGFILSLEDTFLEKPQGGGSIWVKTVRHEKDENVDYFCAEIMKEDTYWIVHVTTISVRWKS